MKLAAVVPIGYLDRQGYQYHAETCLRSLGALADQVVVVPSIRDQVIPARRGLTTLDDPALYFEIAGDQPVFDLGRVKANQQAGFEWAAAQGYDAALLMSVNHYVPVTARGVLRQHADDLIRTDLAWAWVYARMQRGNTLYQPHVRLPYLVNLHHAVAVCPAPDALRLDGADMTREYGDYAGQPALVDTALELTEPDLAAKMTFVRNYREHSANRPATYTWDYYRHYYARKFGNLTASADPLDEYGRAVAERHRSDFISALIRGGTFSGGY